MYKYDRCHLKFNNVEIDICFWKPNTKKQVNEAIQLNNSIQLTKKRKIHQFTLTIYLQGASIHLSLLSKNLTRLLLGPVLHNIMHL